MNFKNSALATAAALSLGVASTASAELTFEADNGWEFGVGGYIPVFAVYQTEDDRGNELDEFTVTTGFNPASLNLRVAAPTQNGLDVSGLFQINNHLGVGRNSLGGDGNDGFGSRIARIDIAGDFGTVHLGKTYGLFGTPAIGDAGSGKGVGGRNGLGSELATLGRIGAGYFYADFEPQIQYVSNRVNGIQVAGSIIQPDGGNQTGENLSEIAGGNADESRSETDSPRIEARVDYQNDFLHVWTSGGIQSVSDAVATVDDPSSAGDTTTANIEEDVTLSGIDFGGQLNFGAARVRANYAMTSGTGGVVWGVNDVDSDGSENDYDQWYVEGTFDLTPVTSVGLSYGEGGPDADDTDDRQLAMLFGRYQATDNLTFMAEVQDHDDADGVTAVGSYQAAVLGAQLDF